MIADICRRMGEGMADFAGEDEDSEVGAFVWRFFPSVLLFHACFVLWVLGSLLLLTRVCGQG